MGELKVPGVSTYIHPLSDDAILSIGLGPADEETGLGLDWSNTRLSLFDVSNFSDPTETQTLSIAPVENPDDEGWSGHGPKQLGNTKHSNIGNQRACLQFQ